MKYKPKKLVRPKERFKNFLKDNEITIGELSLQTGINMGTLSLWLNGLKEDLDEEKRKLLCELFSMSQKEYQELVWG